MKGFVYYVSIDYVYFYLYISNKYMIFTSFVEVSFTSTFRSKYIDL